MKNILFFIVVAVALASCNSTSKAVAAKVAEKCKGSSAVQQSDGSYKIRLHCVNLYDTTEVKKYLTEGKLTYNITGSEFDIVAVSKDSLPNIWEISKAIARGLK